MKGKSVIEVVVVFVLMKLFSIWFDSILAGIDVSSGWRTFIFGSQAIVIPVAIIWLSKRKWSVYGFSVHKFRPVIHYGFIGALLMMLLGAGMGFLKSRGINPSGMEGSLILSAVAVIMITLFVLSARLSQKREDRQEGFKFRIDYKLSILVVLVSCPIIVAIIRGLNVTGIIAWDFYFLLMVGFSEEIKYRGYFQSRINEEFGRPWQVFGIPFGPGLIVVSILFGLSHIGQFGVFNPFLGQYTVNPWMGVQAFLGSLFFGLVREKADSLVASGISHGVPNAFGQVLAMALK
jgi:membrane protease YdiL (CAAX protease family)